MEYTSCAEIVCKLTEAQAQQSSTVKRWWKDCVRFDYENKRTSNKVSWIPIKFNLDGEFKEYKRIKIFGERVYGDVKPFEDGGRKSRDKIPIQIARSRNDFHNYENTEDISDFYTFMKLMNEIFTSEMKEKNSKIYSMIQDTARSSNGEIENIDNPFCRLNIKFDNKGICTKIFDKSKIKSDSKMKPILIDDKIPNQDNIHTLFPSRTLIYGYFELSGVIISPMGVSCSAIAKELAIQIPERIFSKSQHIENLRTLCL
jgi:hypothetical protein